MPPLRERREDIPILVEYFAARYAPRLGKRFQSIEKSSMERPLAYSWPGNVRELAERHRARRDPLRRGRPRDRRAAARRAAAPARPRAADVSAPR